MAAKEPWDYISSGVTADSANTLNLTARGNVRESGVRNQEAHLADDGVNEEIISFDVKPTFFLDVPWGNMNESDSGSVMEAWASSSFGDGIAKRFHYVHAYGTQTHTYIVRFNTDFTRDIKEGNIHGTGIVLKILGKST